jgi:hypothetical protein
MAVRAAKGPSVRSVGVVSPPETESRPPPGVCVCVCVCVLGAVPHEKRLPARGGPPPPHPPRLPLFVLSLPPPSHTRRSLRAAPAPPQETAISNPGLLAAPRTCGAAVGTVWRTMRGPSTAQGDARGYFYVLRWLQLTNLALGFPGVCV